MRFFTAGNPSIAYHTGTPAGLHAVQSLGLDGIELGYTRNCRVTRADAEVIGAKTRELGLHTSAHASYFLNLISTSEATVEKSKLELKKTAEILRIIGGRRIVFHTGWFQGQSKEAALDKARAAMKDLIHLIDHGLDASALPCVLAPEVMGKPSEFGSLREVYTLAAEFGLDRVNPCVDFGHLHARTHGGLNSADVVRQVLTFIEETVTKQGLETMHVHLTGIKFGDYGERKHLPLESGSPDWRMVLDVLKEFNCDGTIVCESPLKEKDALLMQKHWQKGVV